MDYRHGGPFDRGGADSWYRRPPSPHYYVGATYASERIDEDEMSLDEISDYWAGYEDNESQGTFKEW